jgi:MFS superfamily sulfate permease-like transporter
VLDIGATADLDVATIDMLSTLRAELAGRSIDFRLAAVRGSVRDRMRRTGLMDIIGEDQCYLSVETAVAARLSAPAPTTPTPDPPPD